MTAIAMHLVPSTMALRTAAAQKFVLAVPKPLLLLLFEAILASALLLGPVLAGIRREGREVERSHVAVIRRVHICTYHIGSE